MSEIPETRYAKTPDGGSVAYQVSGSGLVDLVVLSGNPFSVDLMWEEPGLVRVRARLNSFRRNVWVETRGLGSSARDVDPARAVDEEMRDVQLTAVAGALGTDRFALWASGSVGPVAIRYAAAHPDRVSALIRFATFASFLRVNDCPWGLPREFVEQQLAGLVAERWGTGMIDLSAPSRKNDERLRERVARAERLWAAPAFAGEWIRALYLLDVRDRLGAVRVPTLVMHRRGDQAFPVEAGRYLAQHIAGAKYVELPGVDSYFFVGDLDAVVDEIEEFLTGARIGADGEIVMAAVLFTDIVASTEHQARLGPREWSRLTDRHDAMVRAALARHGGHEVKTTGDGFLVTFDATGKALRCAGEILAAAKDLQLELRAGVHAGEVEMRGDDIAGLAVSIAKRVCDLARPSEVLVSRTVVDLAVGSDIEFVDRGEHQLKGVPGSWTLYAVPG